jgi:hypothetical protein
MSLRRIAPALAIGFAFAASDAQAFFDPPWITPVAPRAGEIVSVNIRGGVCDAIFEHAGFPQLTQQDNSIHLLEYGDRAATGDLCVYDIGHLARPIGVFPPGDYTVTVDFTYENYPFGYETITLGIVPFAVVGATSAAPVPATSLLWKFVLLALISGIGARAFQMRLRSSLGASGASYDTESFLFDNCCPAAGDYAAARAGVLRSTMDHADRSKGG